MAKNNDLKIYDTLSKDTKPFSPLVADKVSMYVCGPTVYDYLHIGNFRGAIFFNLVRNWLDRSGYKVCYVYNYTDIDDKIIKRATELGTAPAELAKKFIAEFEKDFAALGLHPHDANPRATVYIPTMVETIAKLIKNGKAYVSEGEVLYSIDSFQGYGKLSGKKLDELEAGSRVEVNSKKKNPADFLLWKPAKPGEPAWDSPWGKGRPGWHIECTCMIHGELGEQIDIHGGGIDLIFPHHENEIAQGEGVTGKPYTKYWMHNQFIHFGDEKMSKSLGNVITARKFFETYHPEILKFMILSVHYRSILQFNSAQIQQAIAALDRIYAALERAKILAAIEAPVSEPAKNIFSGLGQELEAGLNEDFNTPVVFSKIYEAVRVFNEVITVSKNKNEHISHAKAFLDWIVKYGGLLALFQENPAVFRGRINEILIREKGIDRAKVDQLVAERTEARKNKDYKRSDEIRNQLSAMEIEILDTSNGTLWTVKKS